MQTQWTIPGTVIQIQRADAARVDSLFQSMFLTGGLSLGQVSSITGLEPYAVQNWVKRGFLSAPRQKRYDMEQVCRILTINTFKSVLAMERICGLLSYVNGDLDSDADDIIRDSHLYFLFVRLAGQAKEIGTPEEAASIIGDYLKDYQEPVPGAKDRVAKALRVMLIAWLAARMVHHTEQLLDGMTEKEVENNHGICNV